jgi:hypothetical protein
MNEREICPQEPMILAARRDGRRDDALTKHLENCASCQDADELAVLMRHMAAMPIEKPHPDPEVIWMMAQLSKPRPRWTPQMVLGIAALAASAIAGMSAWSSIAGYVSRFVPPHAMAVVPLLASCIVAAGLSAVALTTNHLLDD